MKRGVPFAGLLALLVGIGFTAPAPQADQSRMASTAMSASPVQLPLPVFVVPPSAETPGTPQEQFMRIAKCVRSGDTGICPPTSPTGAPGSGGLAKAS